MAVVVAMWLLPAMIASGGPIPFLRANLDYVPDQAGVSSALFGASDRRWVTTFWRLAVWVFCGVLAWGMAAALAFRRKDGFGIRADQSAFLALWLVPWLAFSLMVHVEDPGQTLAMVLVLCLIGGVLVERAIQTMETGVSRLLVPITIAAAIVCDWIWQKNQSLYTVRWLPLVGLGVGLALRILPVSARSPSASGSDRRGAGADPRSELHVLL